jgi:hypothetical protein
MIDSSRSYRRRRKDSAVDKFAVITTVAGVIAALAGVIAVIPASWTGGSRIENPQLTPTNVVAPSPGDISRGGTVVIKKNSRFSLARGQGVLLQREGGGDTFALSESGRVRPGIIRVFANGIRKDIAVGETIATHDSGCLVWIVSEASLMEELKGSADWIFEYHCNS